MPKVWKLNLFLLGFLLVAGAILAWLDSKEIAEQSLSQGSKAISTLSPNGVAQIVYQDEKRQSITLVKKSGAWSLVAKTPMRTNQQAVAEVLAVLTQKFVRKVAEKTTDLVPYGLDAPSARITLRGKQEQILTVGSLAPAGGQRYLQMGQDGPVVLVDGQQLDGVLKKSEDFRDLRLSGFADGVTLQSISRKGYGQTLTLLRENGSAWRLTEPWAETANDLRVDAWVRGLLGVRGEGFSGETSAAVASPWTVAMSAETGEKETLTLWKKGGELLAQRAGDGDSLRLPTYMIAEMERQPLHFVSLQPLEADEDPPTTLTISYNGANLTATKSEARWPDAAWDAVEELLTREAFRAVEVQVATPAWVTVTTGIQPQAKIYPIRQSGEELIVLAPGRRVGLELAAPQASAFRDALAHLFPGDTTKD